MGGCLRISGLTQPSLLKYPVDGDDLSMAFRELYPIVAAAVIWGKKWTCKKIVFMCDNQATVYILCKGRSKCLAIMNLMCILTWTAAVNYFYFHA